MVRGASARPVSLLVPRVPRHLWPLQAGKVYSVTEILYHDSAHNEPTPWDFKHRLHPALGAHPR